MSSYLICGIIIYLVYLYFVFRQISNSNSLSEKQKNYNIILTFLVPFIWGFIVYNILKDDKSDIKVKLKQRDNKNGFSDNWNNLTGGDV